MREAFTTDRPGRFEIREIDDAPAPGPGEVQIRVRACGICGSDLHGMRDPARWSAGRRPGHEIAGEVVATGEGVDRWSVGDRAALQPNLFCGDCASCLSGRIELCERGFTVIGLTLPGGYTELLTVPLAHLHGPALNTEPASWRGRLVPPPSYSFGEHLIWGATARMLGQFLELTRTGSRV